MRNRVAVLEGLVMQTCSRMCGCDVDDGVCSRSRENILMIENETLKLKCENSEVRLSNRLPSSVRNGPHATADVARPNERDEASTGVSAPKKRGLHVNLYLRVRL